MKGKSPRPSVRTSKADPYAIIEKRFGFGLPTQFVDMVRRGFFTFPLDGKYDPNCGYFWFHDMEWIAPPDIPDHSFLKESLPGFLPFAFNGGGDHWCLHRREDRSERVVLCPHDGYMAEIYAPDFSGALYRHMLDYAVGGLDGPEDSETARGNLLRWVKALHGIVPEHLLEKIREIAKQEPSHYPLLRGRAFGFLSHESAQAKEAEDLRCDDLDDEVRWMK